MPAFLARLAVLYPDASDDRDRLQSTFGVGHFVRLSLADKVAQAVSLVIAAQTGVWHRNADGTVREQAEPAGPARYDHHLIADELEMLEMEERGWTTWFSAQLITPFELTYETLSLDPVKTTSRVLHHIGRRSGQVPTVATARLSSSLNDEWVQRFCSEAGSALTPRFGSRLERLKVRVRMPMKKYMR